jgi:photosystem II stability/assembly factor-like uncharacterized protein
MAEARRLRDTPALARLLLGQCPFMRSLAAIFLLLCACGDDGPGWQVVHDELPGALMSVWGTSADDVWAVGADDGDGPTVLHHDGQSWDRLDTGVDGDLWWVHGFAGGPVFMGGADGTILRFQEDSFEALATPGTATVFGIWGASADDVWAVGGAEGGAGGAFAWRFDGDSWREAEGFPAALSADTALWKVWGTAADDVWMVGTGGTILHYDGATITEVSSPTARALFTLHAGPGGRMAAVGGFGTGVLLEHDGDAWRDVTPEGALQMIGVCVTADGGWAVGVDGAVMQRTDDGWIPDPSAAPAFQALHAVWVDPDGGIWAVGGQVLAYPLVNGVMVYRGQRELGSTN